AEVAQTMGWDLGSLGMGTMPERQAAASRYAETNAQDQRYGSDLSWLDPSFQFQDPQLLGPSQAASAYADPRYVQQQQDVYDRTMATAGAPINWESSARQEGLYGQYGQLQAPDWTGSDSGQRA